MAVQFVKRMPLYVNNQLVAEAENVTYRHNTNGERQHAQEGVIAVSKGNAEVDLSCNTIRVINPGAGHTTIEEALANQDVVTISCLLGEKMAIVPMVFNTGEWASDSRTGTLKASFNAQNAGPPDYI